MRVTVRSGDTLSRIARRFGVTLNDLLAANPQITNPDKIRVGDILAIPGGETADLPPPAPTLGSDATTGGDGLAFGDKVSAEFRAKVMQIGSNIGVDPNFLMAVMAFESGGTFSPSVKNAAGSGAVGLIQFMPKTATGLGTSTAELASMTAEEQLDIVERYFRPFRGRLHTLEDTYMAVLLPSAIGKANDSVLFQRPSTAYDQNRGLDANKDGKITKAEAAARVRQKLEAGQASGTKVLTRGIKPSRRPAARIARVAPQRNGLSLHIGLNRVDPKHYGGWNGTLAACELDARDMQALAKSRGFEPTLLLSKQATAKRVTASIAAAAARLRSGDIFLLTYSGHGGQVPDANGDEGEDHLDETWVLFDRQLIDDELYALWGEFERGVRIVVLSDSCHSGSVTRELAYRGFMPPAVDQAVFRAMPKAVETATYQKNQKLYDGIQKANPNGERVAIGAGVLLISGCQDNQLSSDGKRNGLFTTTLRDVWGEGTFRGSYLSFQREITRRMPAWQSPNLFCVGVVDRSFQGQQPFTI